MGNDIDFEHFVTLKFNHPGINNKPHFSSLINRRDLLYLPNSKKYNKIARLFFPLECSKLKNWVFFHRILSI